MTILTDMHSHTYPASHDAEGTLTEMIEAAIGKGISYYGVSNHIDFDYDEAMMTAEERARLKNGNAEEYFNEARMLQRKYEGRIELIVGAEFGFSENRDAQIKYAEFYEAYRPDYVINSVHSVLSRDYCRTELSNDKFEVFGTYLNAVRESLDAIYPYDIVGHLEYLVRYVPFDDKKINISDFKTQIDDILTTIIHKSKILEVNSATKKLDRFCIPSTDILRRYYELGGRSVSFGSDAHSISRLADKYEAIINELKSIGFTYLTIPKTGKRLHLPL